jgi:tRNA(Ile)-lysidine synthase
MLVRDCQRELEGFGIADGGILIAVSAGRDSMVLLDLLHRCMPALRLRGVVAHVNHGLRDLESDADEEHTRQIAQALGMPILTRRIDPQAARQVGSSRERPTLEEASRNLRREALVEMAAEAKCAWIATAHHVGDQAETVLLRLLRGTSPDGLRAMTARSRDGRWLKPLLQVAPDAIQEWATTQGIQWREDASNQDRRFARNRLRLDWIPKLSETFNPQLLRALSDFAEAQGRDLEWIEGLVEEASKQWFEIGETGIRFALDGWESLPEALARRLVRRALIEVGLARDITRTHLLRVLDFLRRGRKAPRNKRLELPGGFSIRRLDECFELAQASLAKGSGWHENAKVHGRD